MVAKRGEAEIHETIRGYLSATTDRSWTELRKLAEVDRIYPSVLTRHLKKFRADKEVERRLHDDGTTSYRLNQPARTVPSDPIEHLDMQLRVIERNPDLKEAPITYYDKFVWVMFELIANLVWASKFKDQKTATEYLHMKMAGTLKEHKFADDISTLMKHRRVVQSSAKGYLTFLLGLLPRLKSDFTDPQFITEYLAFDPTRQTGIEPKPSQDTTNPTIQQKQSSRRKTRITARRKKRTNSKS